MGLLHSNYLRNSATLDANIQTDILFSNKNESGSKIIDFEALKNESAIERRKRIMSGDRRTSYIRKLDALRRAQMLKIEEHTNETEINSRNITHNKNGAIWDFKRQENKTNTIEENLKLSSSKCLTIFPDLENTSLPQCEQNLLFSSKLNCIEDTTQHKPRNNEKIANNISRENECKINTITIPNQVEKFNSIYEHDPILRLYAKKEPSIKTELESKLLKNKNSSEKLNVEIIAVNSNSDKYNIQSSGDNNSNKIYGFFEIPVGIFTQCFNVNVHAKGSTFTTCKEDTSSTQLLNRNGTINFKPEYSYDGFESDLKTDCSISDHSSKSVSNSSININNVIDESIGKNKKTESFTFLAYKRVKNLFQKRIKKMEQEELEKEKSIETINHFKELEELGQDQKQSVLSIPLGNSRTIKHLFE